MFTSQYGEPATNGDDGEEESDPWDDIIDDLLERR